MPSRAYTSFLQQGKRKDPFAINVSVSMPSRAYTSFLQDLVIEGSLEKNPCQCPLGLIPHFYGTPSKT